MINVEGLSDEQLAELQANLAKLATAAREEGEEVIQELEDRRLAKATGDEDTP